MLCKISPLINKILMPFILLLPHKFTESIGLKSVRVARAEKVMSYCSGRLIDIGCGFNTLVKMYRGHGVGVDVHDFGGGALIVDDTSKLPFDDTSFNTVTFIASFNHIPNREKVIKEVKRILLPGGKIVITTLSPFVGFLRHKMPWIDRDETKRPKKEMEKDGLNRDYIINLLACNGFILSKHERFMLMLNNLYIFIKPVPGMCVEIPTATKPAP